MTTMARFYSRIISTNLLMIFSLVALASATGDETPPLEVPLYVEPKMDGPGIIFAEPFSSSDALKRFVPSTASKDGVDDDIAKYEGRWRVEATSVGSLDGDLSLVMRDKAKHHAIAAKLDAPFRPAEGKPLVFQYEVKFQTEHTCGGAYVKLLSVEEGADYTKFHDKTPYTIMFGPDRCGSEEKFHFILRHVHPVSGAVEEKHAKKVDSFNTKYFETGKTHVFRLVLNGDSSYQMSVDGSVLSKGHLLKDMTPPIVPEEMIDDPEDKKPADWDEREKIDDPDAVKPDDWDEDAPKMILDEEAVKPEGWLEDEEAMIPDSTAERPADWDDEMDGDWEAPLVENPACQDAPGCGPWSAPMIDNPAFKGKWRPPLINNPAYSGIWKPRKIKNPDYFEEANPASRITPIAAIGLELWTMSENIAFDNFILADNVAVVDSWTDETWKLKVKQEGASAAAGESIFGYLYRIAVENPILWFVYVVVVALPVVILIIFCCCRGGDEDEDGADTAVAAARRKKTDEPTPDVPVDDEDDDADIDQNVENPEEEGETKEEEEDKGAMGDPDADKGDESASAGKSALNG